MADSSSPGAKARIPNPALRMLEFLIGEWRTEGTHPAMPGKTLTGRTRFSWHEGGAFLMMRSEVDEPQFPAGMAIIGSDDDGMLTMIYFDERRVSRIYAVTAGDGTITWRRDDPKISQSLTITQEGDKLVSKGRISQKGGAWGDDLSQMFTRIPYA